MNNNQKKKKKQLRKLRIRGDFKFQDTYTAAIDYVFFFFFWFRELRGFSFKVFLI